MSKSNSGKIPPADGLTEHITNQAKERRKTQRSLLEVERHARVMRNNLLPELQLKYLPIDSIKPVPRRVRRKEAAQEARLAASIDRFGVLPITVTSDGTIIDGHGIWEIARKKGLPTVPCVVADHLTPNEVRLLRVTLNRLGEMRQWDEDALRLELQELIFLGEDLIVGGFAEAEVDALLLVDEEVPGRESGDAIPSLEEVAVSQDGDLWSLGDHRLLQADCRAIRLALAHLGMAHAAADQAPAAELPLTEDELAVLKLLTKKGRRS